MNYLSLTEAQKYTGKSRSSLRRYVESIVKANDHVDRSLVLPTVAEVELLKSDRHPFSWRINKELLDRKFVATKSGSEAGGSAGSSAGLVNVLNRTVSLLETELVEKNKQIEKFQERQREFNLLIKPRFANVALEGNNEAMKDVEVVGYPPTGKSKESKTKKRRSLWQVLSTPI